MQTSATVTVEEFLRLPDPPEGHLELHHGEVVTVLPPKRGHQRLQWRIGGILSKLTRDDVVGVEIVFRPTPEHEVWLANVGLVSSERELATKYDEYLTGAPELVVEVLSPSDTVYEINDKMNMCLSNGCRSFWVVDPKLLQVSVTENDATMGRITRYYRAPDLISYALFLDEVPVAEIFDSNG